MQTARNFDEPNSVPSRARGRFVSRSVWAGFCLLALFSVANGSHTEADMKKELSLIGALLVAGAFAAATVPGLAQSSSSSDAMGTSMSSSVDCSSYSSMLSASSSMASDEMSSWSMDCSSSSGMMSSSSAM